MASEAALITKFFGRFASAATRTMSATASRPAVAAEMQAAAAKAAPMVNASVNTAATAAPSASAMAKTMPASTMSFRPSTFVNSSAFI